MTFNTESKIQEQEIYVWLNKNQETLKYVKAQEDTRYMSFFLAIKKDPRSLNYARYINIIKIQYHKYKISNKI